MSVCCRVCHLVTVMVVMAVLVSAHSVTHRRNSKFARHWERLDQVPSKISIKRHVMSRTR